MTKSVWASNDQTSLSVSRFSAIIIYIFFYIIAKVDKIFLEFL